MSYYTNNDDKNCSDKMEPIKSNASTNTEKSGIMNGEGLKKSYLLPVLGTYLLILGFSYYMNGNRINTMLLQLRYGNFRALFNPFSFFNHSYLTMSVFISALKGVLLFLTAWRLFKRGNVSGWKLLIPIYRVYTFFKIIFGESALSVIFIILCFGVISVAFALGGATGVGAFLLLLISIALVIVISYSLAVCFGHGIGFMLLSFFFPTIILIIYAWSDNEYVGPNRIKDDPNAAKIPALVITTLTILFCGYVYNQTGRYISYFSDYYNQPGNSGYNIQYNISDDGFYIEIMPSANQTQNNMQSSYTSGDLLELLADSTEMYSSDNNTEECTETMETMNDRIMTRMDAIYYNNAEPDAEAVASNMTEMTQELYDIVANAADIKESDIIDDPNLTEYIVTGESVRVRAEANTSCEILGKLHKGEMITGTDTMSEDGQWILVIYPSVYGEGAWVSAQYLVAA